MTEKELDKLKVLQKIIIGKAVFNSMGAQETVALAKLLEWIEKLEPKEYEKPKSKKVKTKSKK